MQLVSPLGHPLLHPNPFGAQPKGSQLNWGPEAQVPWPSQTEGAVANPSEHEPIEQTVPSG
jgi:hypothetical protein